MEIKPGHGIGLIKFGMLRQDVEFLFGEPNEIKTDEEDDNKIIWIFNEEKLRLTFYVNEGHKLGYIETSNPELKINEKKLIGEKIDVVKQEFLAQKVNDWEHEKYPSFSTYFDEDNYITLHESYAALTELEIGVPINYDEEFVWP